MRTPQDLAGRAANLPVYKLRGGARDRVKAYVSRYPNLGAPRVYAEHAIECKRLLEADRTPALAGRQGQPERDLVMTTLIDQAGGRAPVVVNSGAQASVSAALYSRRAVEHVRYAKIESPPQPAQVQAAVAASDGLVRIFGGAGGTLLIEELRLQGVIATSVARGPVDPPDDLTRRELDDVCERPNIGSIRV